MFRVVKPLPSLPRRATARAMIDSVVKLVPTRSGPMLALLSDRYVGQALERYGEYCGQEGRALAQLIRPGMTVVEVGANMGAHSVDMARGCAPGLFLAFEPQPRLFQLMCANLALNGIANARAYPDACGAAEGEAVMPEIDYAQPGNFGGVGLRDAAQPGVRVRVRPLDGFALARCDLIKIDVEGFEAEVIRGAEATIRRCRPILYVENDRASLQGALIDLIDRLGYRQYWHTPALFDAGNFRGVAENDYPGVVSLNMLCLPRESESGVAGLAEIDPANWTCPVRASG